MEGPKISVILPVYNGQRYLKKTVENLMKQTLSDFEVLIVDNGSTDGTARTGKRLAEEYDRVQLLTLPKPGVSAARNAGIQSARGEYLLFLDVDDGFSKDFLEKLLAAIEEPPLGSGPVDLAFCGYETRCIRKKYYESPEQEPLSFDTEGMIIRLFQVEHYQGFVWNKLFRADLIRKHHLRFAEDICYNEDRLFLLSYLIHCRRSVMIPDRLYCYQLRNGSAQGKRFLSTGEKVLTELTAFERMDKLLKGHSKAKKLMREEWTGKVLGFYRKLEKNCSKYAYRDHPLRQHIKKLPRTLHRPKSLKEEWELRQMRRFARNGIIHWNYKPTEGRMEPLPSRKKYAIHCLYQLAVILTGPLIILFWIGRENPPAPYNIYNLLLILATELIWYAIEHSAIGCVQTTIGIWCGLMVTNDIMIGYRGTPFAVNDIFSIGTANTVIGEYTLTVTDDLIWRLCWSFAYFFGLLLLDLLVKKYTRIKKFSGLERIAGFLAFIIISAIFSTISFGGNLTAASAENSRDGAQGTAAVIDKYGYCLSIYKEITELKMEAPEGYDEESIAASLQKDAVNDEKNDEPNVIVIMNEAWSDLALVGDLETDTDYMPYIHRSIMDGTLETGRSHVSVWAGNTCNTEWEFLTGNSMIYYPSAIPYNQYIDSPKETLVSYFNDLGYVTHSVHPFWNDCYNRNLIYQYFGFDTTYFYDSFDKEATDILLPGNYLSASQLKNKPEGLYVRNKISDRADFEEIISTYEQDQKVGDSPTFIFSITMQNHAPYDYSDYEATVHALLPEGHPDQAYVDQYLSLEKETDAAFEELIDYFENVDEDTIILMFGDHQPGIGTAFYSMLWGMDWTVDEWDFEHTRERYVVPYVIWSNFDLDEDTDYTDLSSNYLSLMLLDKAGLPYNGWYDTLAEYYEEYPVISAAGVMDAQGNWTKADQWTESDDPIANEYYMLQYYRMFGGN